jgi:hypothetical protein
MLGLSSFGLWLELDIIMRRGERTFAVVFAPENDESLGAVTLVLVEKQRTGVAPSKYGNNSKIVGNLEIRVGALLFGRRLGLGIGSTEDNIISMLFKERTGLFNGRRFPMFACHS